VSYVVALVCIAITIALIRAYPRKKVLKVEAFQPAWRAFLAEKVFFYAGLDASARERFERGILDFWAHCAITGVNTEVTDEDRLLVAASAVIPIFSFPEWRYTNLDEVLLYPAMFNERFETAGEERGTLGQVGTGVMSRKMILSKPALHQGFAGRKDRLNTGIHEFVHLIDARDGFTDGLPEVLMDRPYAIPWMKLMKQEMGRINAGRSDIRDYGGVSESEFLPVVSEYFFERPEQLKEKHPELFAALERMFKPGAA
jgi:hypothetical protein